jgi:hypothetical protein
MDQCTSDDSRESNGGGTDRDDIPTGGDHKVLRNRAHCVASHPKHSGDINEAVTKEDDVSGGHREIRARDPHGDAKV